MLFSNLSLPPLVASFVFVIGVMAGVSFRRVWKNEGPRAQLWIFGTVAAVCLLTVGLVPVEIQ